MHSFIAIFICSIALANAHGASAALILNESLANEPGSATTLEWVEVLNWPDTGQAISLTGYKYIDGGQTVTLDTSLAIPAGGFAILARKATGASSFEERWGNASGIWGDHESESYLLSAVSQVSLRNSSDTIRLVSPSGDTSTILWLSDSGDGISVERIRPGSNDTATNFASCKAPSGSTPGAESSVLPARGDLAIDTVVVGPSNPAATDTVRFAARISNIGFGDVALGRVELLQRDDLSAPIASEEFSAVPESGEVSVVLDWENPRPGVTHLLLRLSSDADTSNNSYSISLITRFDKPYLVVSEFLANPEPGGPEEWVEIATVSDQAINLEGLRIGDSLNTEPLPTSAGDIPANGLWVLAENEIAFRSFYPAFNGTVIPIPGWRALNNTGDGIRLIGPSSEIIDSLTFRTVYPNNHSAERMELSESFANPGDWAESVDELGATPGQPNSVVRGNPGTLTLDSIWLLPATPSWGDTIRILAALSNNSFGPASGWSILASRDLDFSAPGASLSDIRESTIPTVNEDESGIVEIMWYDATPSIHRIHVALRDEAGETISTSASVTTVRFSRPLIIISEYMARTSTYGPGEWVELYNASDFSLPMAGLKLGDSADFAILPPFLGTLNSGTLVVLAEDASACENYYEEIPVAVIEVPNWRSLNNTAEKIMLIGAAGEVIDSTSHHAFSYQDNSVERRDLSPSFADPRDWGRSIDRSGATPGRHNSIRRMTNDLSIDSIAFVDGSINDGEDLSGAIWITNTSFAPVDDGRLIVSADPEFDMLAIEYSIPAIGAGQAIPISFVRANPPPGIGRVIAHIGPDEDETNNDQDRLFVVRYTRPVLIVSEYLADPVAPGPGEWIEIYNTSDETLNLSRLSVGDSISVSELPWPFRRLYLAPRSYIVLVQDSVAFLSAYLDFEGRFLQVRNWRELNNSGDKIRLLDALGGVIDTFTYREPYDSNRSAERLDLAPTSSVPSDWTASVDPSGATPGRPNSVNAANAGSFQIDVTPNPVFRSAGQSARIDYRLEIGESLTLKIYDRAGRLVRTIADDVPSATGYIEWNATDDDGYELRPGPYVLLARSEPAGSMKKMVVVIAP